MWSDIRQYLLVIAHSWISLMSGACSVFLWALAATLEPMPVSMRWSFLALGTVTMIVVGFRAWRGEKKQSETNSQRLIIERDDVQSRFAALQKSIEQKPANLDNVQYVLIELSSECFKAIQLQDYALCAVWFERAKKLLRAILRDRFADDFEEQWIYLDKLGSQSPNNCQRAGRCITWLSNMQGTFSSVLIRPELTDAALVEIAQYKSANTSSNASKWFYAVLGSSGAVPPPSEVFVKAHTLLEAKMLACKKIGVVWSPFESKPQSPMRFECQECATPTLTQLMKNNHYCESEALALLDLDK